MNRVFIGYDHRQPVSYSVLHHSIIVHAKNPVSITPLVLHQLPLKRTGLTPFTWSRFLVPYLCGFRGRALFLDIDMLVLGDINEVFEIAGDEAVSVVKNKEAFEWASLMLFNNEHPDNRVLTPEFIEKANGLHAIKWTDSIGGLPSEWNHIVKYDEPRDDAKLVHYTAGVPIFPQTKGGEYTDEWMKHAEFMASTQPWEVLMGRSRHVDRVN